MANNRIDDTGQDRGRGRRTPPRNVDADLDAIHADIKSTRHLLPVNRRCLVWGNDMRIDISEAAPSDKSLLQHMMQLYQYDFSEYTGNDLDDHGLFGYRYLDHYWVEEGRTPLIVRVE